MVSKNPNPPEGFYLDPTGMGLGPFSNATTTMVDDPNKKIRKPYTISKSRESWTEPEHDKFLEALHLFDRDWKKIEAFVGSKTVIQIRSHAQKYFLKVQKSGTNEHLPPPRPKRKASHPYPQKATTTGLSQGTGSFQPTPPLVEPGYVPGPESSSMLMSPAAVLPPLTNSGRPVKINKASKVKVVSNNGCSSSESTPKTQPTEKLADQGTHGVPFRVLPDFSQVYNFIGSVFDPNVSGHLQKLNKMDPIDVETVLLLVRNLSINLASPEFEDHRLLHIKEKIVYQGESCISRRKLQSKSECIVAQDISVGHCVQCQCICTALFERMYMDWYMLNVSYATLLLTFFQARSYNYRNVFPVVSGNFLVLETKDDWSRCVASKCGNESCPKFMLCWG
ncbi:hypothetical protein ACFE04_009285 [Oxalis oulophora]